MGKVDAGDVDLILQISMSRRCSQDEWAWILQPMVFTHEIRLSTSLHYENEGFKSGQLLYQLEMDLIIKTIELDVRVRKLRKKICKTTGTWSCIETRYECCDGVLIL